MAKKTTVHPTQPILDELRAYGMTYPGAHYMSPWPGHKDLAVNNKTFAYLSIEGEPLGIGVKLPSSSAVALMLPFCVPTGYGLGKYGWVSAKFENVEDIDVEMLKQWIDESYRAQAPAKLVKQIGTTVPGPVAAKPKPKPKKKTKKKR
jgi:predicted DNA-binding protein (MmcQ/YjbR family)